MAPPPQSPPAEFDVVIIGSGVAGALMAYRLAGAGVKVLMLEAGGTVPDSPTRRELINNFVTSSTKSPETPFPAEQTAPQPKQDWITAGNNYYDQKGPDHFGSYYVRLVGGSTWHWQGTNIRMLPNDFTLRDTYKVGKNWPLTYRDLEPWYCEAEKEMGVAGSDKENKEVFEKRFGAYRSQPFPMPEITPTYVDGIFAAALHGKTAALAWGGNPAQEFPLLVTTVPQARNSRDYDGRRPCQGRTSCVPLCPTKARYEAKFHVEKAQRAGAVLYEKAMVTRLEKNESGISRVVFRRWAAAGDGRKQWAGEEQSVRGRVVVLAAHALESPKLLLLSDAANSSGLVGKYLMDHPIKSSWALARQPVFPFRGPLNTSYVPTFRDGEFRREFAAFKISIKNDGWASGAGAPRSTIVDFVEKGGFGKQLRKELAEHCLRQITVHSAFEMLPSEDNRVELSPLRDELGMPRPQIHFRVDEGNYVRAAFRKAVAVHSRIFDLVGVSFRNLNDADVNPGPEVKETPRLSYYGSGHILGTTVMGLHPRDSVVDKDCRSWDHPNLFIVGSGAFPAISTANPTLTIAALALRAAEKIRSELRAG